MVFEIGIPIIPKSALYLSQPIDRSMTEQDEATGLLPDAKQEELLLYHKGTQIPEENPEPAVWPCAPKWIKAQTQTYRTQHSMECGTLIIIGWYKTVWSGDPGKPIGKEGKMRNEERI